MESIHTSRSLTQRDLQILKDIWLFRYVTTEQIARLHFPSLKTCQRRLRKLVGLNLVDRFRTDEARRAGFRTWCYRLSRRGADVIAPEVGRPALSLVPSSRRPQSMRFMNHHSLLTDFRIWLREGCTASGGRVGYRFVPSYEEVRHHDRRHRRVAMDVPRHGTHMIPDGVFTLDGENDHHALFTLEIDRGTEPMTGSHLSAVERKLILYRAAFEARSDAIYADLFDFQFVGFRVLCLVPNEKRAVGFLKLAKSLDLAPLLWVGVADIVQVPGSLEARCWQSSPGGPMRPITE